MPSSTSCPSVIIVMASELQIMIHHDISFVITMDSLYLVNLLNEN